ncbi:MAG: hypothetical protein JXI32_00510 [Deltaproteobacteria bacterium]|nr:hypothetical protein [Deltaproteobacteria bacterium]
MKRNSIIASFLVLICSLSLLFVSGCASDQAVKAQTIKSDASMNDILAEETAKSRAEIAAMKEAAAKKAAEEKAAAERIKSDASMNDILAEETAKSRAEIAAMKEAAAKKAAEEKAAKEKTTK